MAKPGSCNSGFKSRPSSGAGNKRSKGFEVNNRKRIKPILTSPITPKTLATVVSGIFLLKKAINPVQIDKVNAHNNKDPSCAPQTPETR